MTENNNTNNFCEYSEEEVIEGIKLALKLFMYKDSDLIKCDLHEMAITHRLAIYLVYVFSDCDVDCEWNRNIALIKGVYKEKIAYSFEKIIAERLKLERKKEKKIMGLITKLENIQELISKFFKNMHSNNQNHENNENLKINQGELLIDRKIRPDIIIHKREKEEHNLVAIEVKVKNTGGHKKYEIDKCFDFAKLYEMTTRGNLKYRYGFYIELPKKVCKHTNISIEKSEILNEVFGKIANKVFEIKFNIEE